MTTLTGGGGSGPASAADIAMLRRSQAPNDIVVPMDTEHDCKAAMLTINRASHSQHAHCEKE